MEKNVYRLLLVSSLILCSLVVSTIQIPHVLASSNNQTSDNGKINKKIQAKITLATDPNETLATQNSPTQSRPDSTIQGQSKLPKWIKSTFTAYSQSDISEGELLNAVTFLVQNNIIKIQSVSQPSTTTSSAPSTTTSTSNNDSNPQGSSKLPKWIKSTFTAYSQSDISEGELLNAVTFLVQNNIIKIQSVSQPSTTTSSAPSTTTSTSNQPVVTNFDFSGINENPDNYKDRLGKFSGKITKIDTQKGLTSITLQLEENSYNKLMFVILNNQDASKYVKDDCVSVEGFLKGGDRDPNAFGALLPYPKLNDQKINKISCLDALYPSLKTVDLNLSQKAGSVTVTVSKVVFAEKHTRFFVTIQNFNTDREVYFSHQPIIQNHFLYNSTSNAADEKGVSYRILPGIIEKGYIFYDPVPQQPFELNLGAREQFLPSRDTNGTYNALDHKLTFDIPIT